jgi:hypothetical protein
MFWQLMRALRLPALYSYDELNETVLSFEPLDKIACRRQPVLLLKTTGLVYFFDDLVKIGSLNAFLGCAFGVGLGAGF